MSAPARLSADPAAGATASPAAAHRSTGRFAGLPEPARRWLSYAIAPGQPPADRVLLAMHGTIRLGRWREFTARELISTDPAYLWSARSNIAGLPVRGYDRYSGGVGRSRWWLAGLVPVLSARGREVTLSAQGRLAAELVLLPSSLVSARWSALDADRACYHVSTGGPTHQVQLVVDACGAARRVSLPRWGNPDGTGFRQLTFTVDMAGELAHGGFRLPSSIEAAWYEHGRPVGGEPFFRATLDAVTFR
jgi:hypothetical protein